MGARYGYGAACLGANTSQPLAWLDHENRLVHSGTLAAFRRKRAPIEADPARQTKQGRWRAGFFFGF